MTEKELRQKAKRINQLLDKRYGKLQQKSKSDPLDVLIQTILSQNTTDINSHRAFRNLKSQFSTWDEVRQAPLSKIVTAINVGGLAEIKAKRIKDILQQIYEEHGKTDLNFLNSFNTQSALDYLLNFKGVGLKTAYCVLLFAFGRPAMPVDTHIFRVSKRLGLIPPSANIEQAHSLLQALVFANSVYSFHLNLIQHGRTVCKPKNPRCSECVLNQVCEFFTISGSH